jgi:hypothetical protein
VAALDLTVPPFVLLLESKMKTYFFAAEIRSSTFSAHACEG